MDDQQDTTGERPVSQTREQIAIEAKRIEESLLHSSKGHFAAADRWANLHLWIGLPMILFSSIAGAAALSEFDPKHIIAGLLSIIVAVLSAVITFLNPNQKVSAHLAAGNSYDALLNEVRIFRTIGCWEEKSDAVISERLRHFSARKTHLNQTCPQVPRWAYLTGKKGIDAGEGKYAVDV
ncbi:MAG TPA: SLATT domain-containing protein [Rhizomicrobium sp.]|nr:SLATT domain-containing protein [Rhizomicrobium sp.]